MSAAGDERRALVSGTVSGERAPKNKALGTFPDAAALLPQPGGFDGLLGIEVAPNPNRFAAPEVDHVP
jgi:hypothetical protein